MDYDGNESLLVPPKSPYHINSKILLTAITSLSIVVVFIIILRLYGRWFLHRQARRRALLHHLGIEQPKTGLDPIVIASLPSFIFKRVENEADTEMECAICLSFLEEGEMARTLPNCKHSFHVECVNKWLSSNSTCPICRTEAEPRAEHGASELAPPQVATPVAPVHLEEALIDVEQVERKAGASTSRLSSLRRMLSRERSLRRVQSCDEPEDGIQDLERQ